MEPDQFDHFSRRLGAGLTRRSGLLGVLGAALAGTPSPSVDAATPRGQRMDPGLAPDKRPNGPSAAAPCGKGKKANACKHNRDCCTNICKTKIRNKDGLGRCRCLKKGRRCSEDRNCCRSLTCVAGQCGGTLPMVETGAACGPDDVCRDPSAACMAYDFATPAGTYCLLPTKSLCSSGRECATSQCLQGTCRPCSSAACAEDCTPIVCASCTYTTVQAAITAASDGDVIAIGRGTYVEDLTISAKELTLRACPGERVTLRNAHYENRTIAVSGGKSLTLLDVIVDGYHNRTGGSSGGGVSSDGDVTLVGTSVIKNAGWKASGAGIRLAAAGKMLTVTDDAVIHDTEADSYGGGISVEGESDIVISGWAQLLDNYSDLEGAGVYGFGGVNVTISDHARIVGNTAQVGGAAVSVSNYTAKRATTVTVQDDVVISDNRSLSTGSGGGGLVIYGCSDGPVAMSVKDRVLISGNAAPLARAGGGGIMVLRWVAATISGEVEIAGNSASNGGGVLALWQGTDRPADWVALTITDSVKISDNTAIVSGGGVASYGSLVELTGSATVSGNRAPKGGGCVIWYHTGYTYVNSGAMTISGSATITGNLATDSAPSGGGIWSDNNANTLTVVSGTITGNTPDQCAGGTISC